MMKRILILSAIVICAAGCLQRNDVELGPDATVEAFYHAVSSGDFESAGRYCNAVEMAEYINSIRTKWEKCGESISAILPAIMAETDVIITDMTKNGQNRTIFYTLTSGDGTQKEKIATLGKIEGIWKITAITDRH